MEFEATVTTDNPTRVLTEMESQSELEDFDIDQADPDRAFPDPGAVEIIIEFVSDPDKITPIYVLLRDLGRVVIDGNFDDEIDAEEFILENTQTEEDNLELVQQDPLENATVYEYRDTSRAVMYEIRIPDSGSPQFKMYQEDD